MHQPHHSATISTLRWLVRGLVLTCSLTLAIPASAQAPATEKPTEKPAEKPAANDPWTVLTDGSSLENWKITNFGGEGPVEVENNVIILERGSDLTGITWNGKKLARINYELTVDAKRVSGSDFFCGIVFPVGDAYCSYVAGGWGGSLVGLSSIDGKRASENSTASSQFFKDNQWYRIRLRVTEHAIHSWIDDKQVIDLETAGKKITVHPAVELCKPLGISCYATTAAIRNVKFRELTKEEIAQTAPKK